MGLQAVWPRPGTSAAGGRAAGTFGSLEPTLGVDPGTC